MVDWYAVGAANVTPHIHVYNGGAHLKDAYGTRYDLIKMNRKVRQTELNDAFDQIRQQFPNGHVTGTLVIAAMRLVLRGVPRHKDEPPE